MPRYDPPYPHEARREEFLTAALCYAVGKLDPKDLSGFPGLVAWKLRHDVIDAAPASEKLTAQIQYDSQHESPQGCPEFMAEFFRTFPARPE